MDAFELAVSMALNVQIATATGIVAATPGSGPDHLSAILKEIEKLRGQLAQMMRAQVLVAALYTYRNASDEELRGYVEFADTGPARRYHRATFRAFERAMVEASQRFGQGVARSLRGGAA